MMWLLASLDNLSVVVMKHGEEPTISWCRWRAYATATSVSALDFDVA